MRCRRLALGLGFCLLLGTALCFLWVYVENWLPFSYVPYYLPCPEIFPGITVLSHLCPQQHATAVRGEAIPARDRVTVPSAQAAGAEACGAAGAYTLVGTHRVRGNLQPRAAAPHLPASEPDHRRHGVCRREVHGLPAALPGVRGALLHAGLSGTVLHLHR
uniref:Globoside alpha-1,3-N-acetylgalactosaminyltransferase 1 (FORS blood group) n=1 Tax=Neovison vison TaxID=452646 RepID=A0A8C7EV47_NEOVI